MFFNFALVYAIKKAQINQDGLKLNGTDERQVYADHVSILDRSVDTIKKNTESLVVPNKETGLEVNTDNTKFMVMSPRLECRT